MFLFENLKQINGCQARAKSEDKLKLRSMRCVSVYRGRIDLWLLFTLSITIIIIIIEKSLFDLVLFDVRMNSDASTWSELVQRQTSVKTKTTNLIFSLGIRKIHKSHESSEKRWK